MTLGASKVTAAAAALGLFVAGTLLLVPVHATPEQGQPAFDVASVKANVSFSGNSNIRPSPGRVIVSTIPLKGLIVWAYNVRIFRFREAEAGSMSPAMISRER